MPKKEGVLKMKKQWRKRVHGTNSQKGKSFMLPTQSMQRMKHNLPKVRVPMQYPTGRT